MNIPKFTPTSNTYEQLVWELDEYLDVASKVFDYGSGFPSDAVSTAFENFRDGHQYRPEEAMYAFRKQNPEPDEEEYFRRGDVYDKKRKLFITADQALSKAEKEYNAAEAKFVDDAWKEVYTNAIDHVTE